jgi:hypothetical protein
MSGRSSTDPMTRFVDWARGRWRMVLPTDSSVEVPPAADVIAAGCAVAGFGTFFPCRGALPLPIAIGMLAHAIRWALVAIAGFHVTT